MIILKLMVTLEYSFEMTSTSDKSPSAKKLMGLPS